MKRSILLVLSLIFIGWKNVDPIDRLVLALDSHGLWKNGISGTIDLPQSASPSDILAACLGEQFAASAVREHKNVRVWEDPAPYQAALVDSAAGEKIILYRYEGKNAGWWSRVFDVGRLAVDLEAPRRAYSVARNGQANGWKGGYRISFRVTNVSKVEDRFELWSCSSYQNWRTDDARVVVPAWTCKKDGLKPQALAPGGTFSGDIPVQISPALAGQKVTFKLAFDPSYKSDGAGPFWSAPMTVAVGD